MRNILTGYRMPFQAGSASGIAIARALSSNPDIIVLDEPTSALDISVQAQILNLLVKLQQERNLTYVLISHNVSVVRHMSDRVAVMYLGQIVELGTTDQVLVRPRHPYTRLLLDSVPRTGEPLDENLALRKTELPGNRHLPTGCYFRDRCPQAAQGCEHSQSLQPSVEGCSVRLLAQSELIATQGGAVSRLNLRHSTVDEQFGGVDKACCI